MHRDRDFDPTPELPANADGDLTQDLELEHAAGGDGGAATSSSSSGQGGAAVGPARSRWRSSTARTSSRDCLSPHGDRAGRCTSSPSRRSGAEKKVRLVLAQGYAGLDPAPLGAGARAAWSTCCRRLRQLADGARGRVPLGGVHALLRDARGRARRRLPRRPSSATCERLEFRARRAGQRQARQRRQGRRPCRPHAARAGLHRAAHAREPVGAATPSGSPIGTRAGSGRWPSCEGGASTWSPTRSPSRPTTSSASSPAAHRARLLPRLR